MVSLASSTGQPRPTARHRPLNAPKPRNSHAWSGSGHGWPRNGIVYNVRGVLREGVPMKYPAIREYSRRYPIRLKCRTLAVSPAGYYAWIDRPESCRAVHNRIRLSEILVIHRESRETYGSPSIGDALVKRGGTRLVSIAWPGSCAPKGFRPNPSRNSARRRSRITGCPWRRTHSIASSRSHSPIRCGPGISPMSGPRGLALSGGSVDGFSHVAGADAGNPPSHP